MFNADINIFEVLEKAPGPIPGTRAAHLYPSGASVRVKNQAGAEKVYGGCLREQYLKYKGEAPSDIYKDNTSLGVWLAGDQIQDVVEERFKRAGIFVQSELHVFLPEYNVSGRIDTIIHNRKEGDDFRLMGVEIKSKSGYNAQTSYIRANKSAVPTEFRPSDEHILQSMVYMHACNTLPTLQEYNIKKWLVLYVLRDSYDFNYFEIELTPESYSRGYGYPVIYSYLQPEGFVYTRFKMQDVLDRWKELNAKIAINSLPERDFTNVYSNATLEQMSANGDLSATNQKFVAAGKHANVTREVHGNKEPMGDFACAYCDYRSKCWNLGKYVDGYFT